jgi:hypothetical protein
MKRWWYLNYGNRIYEWLHRNSLKTWYMANYDNKVWQVKPNEKAIPLKELMQRKYVKF